jgi:hypothetical protein
VARLNLPDRHPDQEEIIMKVLTFAVGLAAGYVLGTRAGRESYEQLVQRARQVANSPTVVQAQEKAKEKAKDVMGMKNSNTTDTTTTTLDRDVVTPLA